MKDFIKVSTPNSNLQIFFASSGDRIMKFIFMAEGNGEIVIYQTPDGETSIDVMLDQETVWLTRSQMEELFLSTRQNITPHIRNIFNEGELDPTATVK